ncbi:MAG: murein biosynthesis integral membrane protein MurJ [Betaproteobacteria bacterium]|nr:murein biosynthesis integral membrane protein MurJ [Betaproteobacteria bacterium]
MSDIEKPNSSERTNLAKRSAYASLGVLLSRFSGVFRSQVVNAVFGASTRLDAFNVALRFPSVLRDLFAEGALSSAFTKELVEAQGRGHNTVRSLVAVVSGFFLCVTLLISLLGAVFAQPIVAAVTSESFHARGGFVLAVDCFRILVFYLPIAMLSALAMSLLGNRGQTFRATIASAFFNVGTIAGALSGGTLAQVFALDPVLGLAYGTLAGGLLQFFYQLTPLVRDGLFPWPCFSPKEWWARPELRSMLLMMAPRAVSQGALSLALFVNTHFATAAGEGAITYITNAQVIILVPVGLFGVAASFASLPMLAQAVQERDSKRLGVLLSDSLAGAVWLSWLSLLAFATLAVPFCVGLLEHGKVTALDSVQNAVAVCAYAIGMVFNSGSKVLMQGFFALNDVRRSVINAFIYLSLNATLSALLAPRLGIIGLGLSNSISAAIDFVFNWYFLNRVASHRDLALDALHGSAGRRLRTQLLCLGTSAFVIGIVGVFLAKNAWLPEAQLWGILGTGRFTHALLWLVVLGGIWGTVAAVLLWFWGPENLRRFLKRGLSRFFPGN